MVRSRGNLLARDVAQRNESFSRQFSSPSTSYSFPRYVKSRRVGLWWILCALTAIVVSLLSGCGSKKISKGEIRAVTSEVVAAAQKIPGRKSEVTIRPELQPSKIGEGGRSVVDNIYVSLSDASQTGAFKQALNKIAQRHKLSVVEATSPGVVRFDYAFDGSPHAYDTCGYAADFTDSGAGEARAREYATGDHH